jgi:hypothetical protein
MPYKTEPHNYSVDDLVRQADSAMDKYEPLLALKFMERAFEMQPSSNIAESVGTLHMESMNLDSVDPLLASSLAREWFLKAASLEPQTGAGKYLYLGQLSAGVEAIQFYENAVRLLTVEIPVAALEDQDVLKTQYSAALCSMTEIYMTDLWYIRLTQRLA